MSDTEQVKQKNPKRVEAGKKSAEARRLKKMQQSVTEVTKPIVDSPTLEKETPIKINVHKTYLPACLAVICVAGLMLYAYKSKPVQKVDDEPANEPVNEDTETKEYDPFDFLKKKYFFINT